MASKMHNQHPHRISLIIVIGIMCSVLGATNGNYLIGVGSFDMTGPAAGVNMMGYANMDSEVALRIMRSRAVQKNEIIYL
jgi:neutral ceramidase